MWRPGWGSTRASRCTSPQISGSWPNLAEVFFGIITRQGIRRGTFTSVADLVASIRRFIESWNERCQPFIWTATADEILPHATVRDLQTRETRNQERVTGYLVGPLRKEATLRERSDVPPPETGGSGRAIEGSADAAVMRTFLIAD